MPLQPDPRWQPNLGSANPVHPSQTSALAITALVLGLSAFACFGPLTAVPAIAVGIAALFEIRSSSGRKGGSLMAIAGIAVGSVNTLFYAALLGFAFYASSSAKSRAHSRPSTKATRPSFTLSPPPTPPPLASSPRAVSFPAPHNGVTDNSTITTTIGHITVVDIGIADSSTLRSSLRKQQRLAKRENRILLLQTGTSACRPCLGIAAALPSAAMQRALRGTRLIRVDSRIFRSELRALGIPTNVIPGFFLVDRTTLRPLDAIHGGEWDNDTSENIAPILNSFVRGTLTKRRERFLDRSPRPLGTVL